MHLSPVFTKVSAPVVNRDWSKNAKDGVRQKKTDAADAVQKMPWVKDKLLRDALAELKELKFDPNDIKYLKNMGVNVPYKSGKEAVDFIAKNNIRIIFDKPSEKGVHAQYDFSRNIITINERYKKSQDFSIMLAIGEALLHEAGHAKDFDGESSIQEELDFLGMNAVAHRAFLIKYGNLFSDSNAPIINDGVSVYAKLFFEPDPEKQSLIKRLREKYGDLPTGDRMHPPGKIAREIKRL